MHKDINVNVSGPVQPTSTYKTVVLKGQAPFAAQVTEPNIKYVIKHNFDLDGEEITIPEGCLIEFDGGAISNGTLVGNNTGVQAGLIKIFNTDITISGSWNVAKAYPEWFGATGDGITDDSSCLQAVINNFVGSNIVLKTDSIYRIESNVNLVSNTILNLNGSTLKAKGRNDVGKYSNTIFTGNQIENIYILNGTFDNDTNATGFVSTDDISKVNNCLRFNSCSNIKIENCTFKKYLSNTLSNNTDAWRSGYWANIFFFRCNNVLMSNCELKESAIEGWLGFECTDIVFNKCLTYNTYMSTPISVLFSSNAKLLDCKIYEDVNRGENKGSTINWYNKNSEIAGCYFEGGTGVDLGNESLYPSEPFDQENLNIHDNVINVMVGTITRINGAYYNIKDSIIHNNIINSYIRTGNCQNLVISSNQITSEKACITSHRSVVKNLIISGNNMKGPIGFIFTPAESTQELDNLTFIGNVFESYDVTGSATDVSGFGISINGVTEYTLNVGNISVVNNTLKCRNGWIRVEGSFQKTNLIVTGNILTGISTGRDRGIYLMSPIDMITFNNNTIIGGNWVLSSNGGNILDVENNMFLSVGTEESVLVQITASATFSKIAKIVHNYMDAQNSNTYIVNLRDRNIRYSQPLVIRENIPDKVKNSVPTSNGDSTGRQDLSVTPNMVPYYDSTKNKVIFSRTSGYVDCFGASADVDTVGTVRPNGKNIYVGFVFIDQSLNPARPIFAAAIGGSPSYHVTWVDATGATV